MISSGKVLANLDSIRNGTPVTADIFLTNYCNNHCQYCAYGRWKELKKTPRYMRAEDFKLYLIRLKEIGVKGIILTGGGEPTVNPDFDEITAFLEEHNFPYGINTNFNRLELIRPVYLKISLDGACRGEYRKIRGVDAWEKVMENIKAYVWWKKKNKVQTKVGIQCVADSVGAVVRFYKAYQGLDVDYMVFRPIESTLGEYKWKEDPRKIIQFLQKLSHEDPRVVMNYKWEELHTRFTSCAASMAQIAIDETGHVMYCCHKPYEIVGHILDSDILEKKKAFHTDMSMCDIPCRMTGPNKIMDEMRRPCADSMFI